MDERSDLDEPGSVGLGEGERGPESRREERSVAGPRVFLPPKRSRDETTACDQSETLANT